MPLVMSDAVFSPGQWAAARMLVARLHCEAQGVPFEYTDIGLEWLNIEDKVCARTDTGVEIYTSDVLFAGIILLWSLLCEQSFVFDEDSPLEAVARLGLGIAQAEP